MVTLPLQTIALHINICLHKYFLVYQECQPGYKLGNQVHDPSDSMVLVSDLNVCSPKSKQVQLVCQGSNEMEIPHNVPVDMYKGLQAKQSEESDLQDTTIKDENVYGHAHHSHR